MDWGQAFESGVWREEAPDIISLPFLTSEACAAIAEISNAKADRFQPYQPDVDNNSAPGQELRLNLLDEAACRPMLTHVADHVFPAIGQYWRLCKPQHLRMPFILWTGDGARAHLDLHHDVALVSGGVRLTDGHKGGALTFPRQDWNAASLPVGRLLLWPSQVSHPHFVTPVAQGKRLSLTLWMTRKEPHDPIC